MLVVMFLALLSQLQGFALLPSGVPAPTSGPGRRATLANSAGLLRQPHPGSASSLRGVRPRHYSAPGHRGRLALRMLHGGEDHPADGEEARGASAEDSRVLRRAEAAGGSKHAAAWHDLGSRMFSPRRAPARRAPWAEEVEGDSSSSGGGRHGGGRGIS